jgi:diadenosine tetraphosphatase ApaH/serine/threonine PP2A family protein phosphatase
MSFRANSLCDVKNIVYYKKGNRGGMSRRQLHTIPYNRQNVSQTGEKINVLLGVIGDIHGNIDALRAVVAELQRLAVDDVLCAGDVVGYGGAPGECIDFLRENKIASVCGNHDFFTLHADLDNEGIREEAVKVFEWNRKVLTNNQMEWLDSLPMVLESPRLHYQVRHASCQPFPNWGYVISEHSAALHFMFQSSRVCFNGHSHVPIIAFHTQGEHVNFQRLSGLVNLPPDHSVLVGVGSVGQPRDGDNRACGVVYDTNAHSVYLFRVPYDIDAAQRRIYAAHLPNFLAERLSVGR